MTLGISWVRVVGGTRELVVASDSRLSGGEAWDSNPKIMLLPRSDAVLSFAGHTRDAYPLMLQAFNAVAMYPPAQTRAMDIQHLKGHLIRVFNRSREFITNLPSRQKKPDNPEAQFVLSGYSWRSKKFHVWTLYFDPHLDRFTFRPATQWRAQEDDGFKLVTYVGSKQATDEAKERLKDLLRSRNKIKSGSFDMEPFEVLRDIIRDKCCADVGGPPQVVKIYEHLNAAPIGVYWPNRESGTISILGRPLMYYEKTRWGVIDPDFPDRARPMPSSVQ